MPTSYRNVAAQLRKRLTECVELTKSLLTMYRCGSDQETRDVLEECYQDLWHLGGRINRALRVKVRRARAKRKKLPVGQAEEIPAVEPAAKPADDGNGAGGGTAPKGSRRKRKRELWDKLRGQSTD